jgi:hypothetical protein
MFIILYNYFFCFNFLFYNYILMTTRSNLMKPMPIMPYNKDKLPYLPTEILLIIMKIKEDIEDYEKTLTDKELFQRRLTQGWTIPESHKGNWIERSKQKRVEEYNKMSIYKRLLWQIGLFENPEIERLDPERAKLSKVLDYTPYRHTNDLPRFESLNGGSKKLKRLKKRKNKSKKIKNHKLRN